MKVTQDIFDKYKNKKNGLCEVLNDDYVLLKKKMPVEDEHLEEYISNIKKAKKNGINISTIVDYKLIPGTTTSFMKGVSYTAGVFIEERAKGNNFVFSNNFIMLNDKDINFEDEAVSYFKTVSQYINELEARSLASQSVYDKLVRDYVRLKDFGLECDPKPSNFFYDIDNGFTIIDVISDSKRDVKSDLVEYLANVIMGYGKPMLMIDTKVIRELPEELNLVFKDILGVISSKLSVALVNNGYEDLVEKVVPELNKKAHLSNNFVQVEDMSTHISEVFASALDYRNSNNNSNGLIF